MSLSNVININLRRSLMKKDKYELKKIFKEYSKDEIQKIDINIRRLYLTVETRHSYHLFKMLMENDIFPSPENKKNLIIENLINDRCGKHVVYLFKNRPDLSILEFNEHWTSNALFGACVKFDFSKEKNKELLSYILKQIPLDVIDKEGDNVITYLLSNIQEKMANYSHYSFKKRPLQDIDMMLNNVYFFSVNKGVNLKHEKNGESILEMFNKIETKNLSGKKEHQDLRIKIERIKNTIFSDAEKNKILKAINERKEEKKPANKKRL